MTDYGRRSRYSMSPPRRPFLSALPRAAFDSIFARPHLGQIHLRRLWWTAGETRIFTLQRGQSTAPPASAERIRARPPRQSPPADFHHRVHREHREQRKHGAPGILS